MKTFIAIKPDGLKRKLVGEIIMRFERLGLDLVAMKLTHISTDTAKQHYIEHIDKPFFERLVSYMTSAPIIITAWQADNDSLIEIVRKVVGTTDPVKSPAGTIRGDFATHMNENIIHASDSPASAERELRLFFPELFQ